MKLRHRLLLLMLAVFLPLLSLGTGIIIEQSFTSAVHTERDRALTEAAAWVGCDSVAVERVVPGELAPALGSALRSLSWPDEKHSGQLPPP